MLEKNSPHALDVRFHIFALILSGKRFACFTRHSSRLMVPGAFTVPADSMRPKQTRKLIGSQGAMENSQDNDGTVRALLACCRSE